MQTLTPQELEQARTLRLQGKSTDEVYNYIAGKRINAPSRLSTVRQEPLATEQPSNNLLADAPQDIFSGVKQLGEGYLNRFEGLKDTAGAALRGEQTFGETATQLSANIAGGAIADPAFQLAKTGASLFTTPQQEQKIGEALNRGIQTVDEKAGISNWYSGLEPRTQRNIDAILNILDVAPIGVFGKVKSLLRGTPKVDATPKLEQVISKAEQGDTTDAVRVANAALDETTRTTEVDKLARAYQDSLVGDRVKVNRLLQEQAADMSLRGEVVTQDQLIKNLANEGVIPDVRGKLADFTTEIRNLDARQNELFNAYRPVLEASPAKASIDDFASYASRSMAESPNLRFELDKAEGQLNTILNNLRRSYALDETGQLTASQIDDISRQANARTKAYRETDTFQADVYSELGRAARQWLNENIPDQSFRQVNDEWLRLEQIKRTAEAMQNQQVDVGLLGRAIGSYVTTLTGVTLGASVGNPFMAVAAGVLTKLGGDAYADALRSRTFSPEIRQMLQDRLTNDKALITKLKETATTQENKNLYDQMSRMLPPARSEVRSEVGSGAPITATQSGASAPAGQLVESVAPGAIKQPAQTGQLRKQAEHFKSVESFVKAVDNNPAWKKKFTEAGVTAEEIGKMVIGGGTALGLIYLLDNESLSGNGFLVMGSILGGATARTKFVKQILKNTNEADLVEMSDFVNAHKAGAYTTNNKGELIVKETKNFTKEEADKALQDALRRAEDFPVVSDASLKELRDVFDDVLKQSEGKVKGATPQTMALLEEAKPGTKLYHGTPNTFEGKPNFPFYLTTDPDYAKVYQNASASSLATNRKAGNAGIMKFEVNPKARVLDLRTPEGKKALEEYWSTMSMSGEQVPTKTGLPDWTEGENIAEFIEERGLPFDAILLDEGGVPTPDGVQSRGVAFQALNEKAIKGAN